MMERAMEHFNVQLNRLTRSLRRARTVELPEGETSHINVTFYSRTFEFRKTSEVVKATLDILSSSLLPGRIPVYGHSRSFGFIHIWSITTKHLKAYMDHSHVGIYFTPKYNNNEIIK